MSSIRPFRLGDEAELSAVCLQTADSGADATGLLDDDELWAQLFVLPYVAHDPELAFVVETDDGRVAGYVVAVADTDAFERWFRDTWWPAFAERWPEPAAESSAQDRLLRYAYSRGRTLNHHSAEYPAHLHIDLLPELQRQGFGRRLIDALKDALRDAGVHGVHAIPRADNTPAVSFYERLGFDEITREDTVIVFGMRL
jgi:ribosomal protein S18 acetylase RimI-like enzyme